MTRSETPAPTKARVEIPPKGAETGALLRRGIEGDKGCQEQLDALLNDPERAPRIIEVYGNPPLYAEFAIVKAAAGKNLVVQGALHRKVEDLRAELAGPNPTPIARLLAERAAYCWLIVWRYEEHLANATELTTKQADFHQRRIDAAHRRYLSSLRTLAQVRKLAVPKIQVNVGQNQVNVAGQ